VTPCPTCNGTGNAQWRIEGRAWRFRGAAHPKYKPHDPEAINIPCPDCKGLGCRTRVLREGEAL